MAKNKMQQVRTAQPAWFSKQNKRFFHDHSYCIRVGRITKANYLVRRTSAWTDMFGEPQRPHFRINRLGEDWKIGRLVDEIFSTMKNVMDWLKSH